jgi:hypothetical protein
MGRYTGESRLKTGDGPALVLLWNLIGLLYDITLFGARADRQMGQKAGYVGLE